MGGVVTAAVPSIYNAWQAQTTRECLHATFLDRDWVWTTCLGASWSLAAHSTVPHSRPTPERDALRGADVCVAPADLSVGAAALMQLLAKKERQSKRCTSKSGMRGRNTINGS